MKETPNKLMNLTYLVVTILALARLAPTKTQVINSVRLTLRAGKLRKERGMSMTSGNFGLALAVVLFGLTSVQTSAESQKTTEQKNSFGGKTIEVTYQKGDASFETLDAALIYYDQDGKIAKTLGRLNTKKSQETNIAFQEELFKNGRTVAYKMFMTDNGKRMKGYDYVMEWVDDKDNVVTSAYGKGGAEVVDRSDTFMSKYPFFTIQYIKDVVLEAESKNPTGDTVTFSAKYNSGRAFVEFSSDIVPMTELDTRIAGYYFASRGIHDGLDRYHKKITVIEDGKTFILYLQDTLLPFIHKEKRAIISYVAICFNSEIYPLLTGLVDMK